MLAYENPSDSRRRTFLGEVKFWGFIHILFLFIHQLSSLFSDCPSEALTKHGQMKRTVTLCKLRISLG